MKRYAGKQQRLRANRGHLHGERPGTGGVFRAHRSRRGLLQSAWRRDTGAWPGVQSFGGWKGQGRAARTPLAPITSNNSCANRARRLSFRKALARLRRSIRRFPAPRDGSHGCDHAQALVDPQFSALPSPRNHAGKSCAQKRVCLIRLSDQPGNIQAVRIDIVDPGGLLSDSVRGFRPSRTSRERD